jgi:hypothetical protein
VPTVPETLALLTTGALPPPEAAAIFSVMVAGVEVPDALVAVTLTAIFVAVAVGVPVMLPLELMLSPYVASPVAVKFVGALVADTCTGVIAVPTVPETLALLTTGTLPPPEAAAIFSVMVAGVEVPDALVAVTLTAIFVAVAVGVPVILPVELMLSPYVASPAAVKFVGEFVADTWTGVIAVPTVPVTVALLTTGTLPPPEAAAMLSVRVAAAEVPDAFDAVTLTVAPLAAVVGVPVIKPLELIERPYVASPPAIKFVGEFVADTWTGVIAVPTVPVTVALLTTGALPPPPPPEAETRLRVIVAGAEVPVAFVPVTLIVVLTVAFAVPVI